MIHTGKGVVHPLASHAFHISNLKQKADVKVWNLGDHYHHLHSTCNNFTTSFANWIYDQLEKEDEYRSSDEAVEEMIRANEYRFDETGFLI